MSLEFHLENRIGTRPVAYSGMCQEGDEAVLESLEAALDPAFGLGCWRHRVGDVKRPQDPLELAARIGVVMVGAWPEQAQAGGVDRLGQTVALECLTKMQEVIPGGVALDKPAGHVEAGAVVYC